MNRTLAIVIFFAVWAMWAFDETQTCNQCGKECAVTCGTRLFRACCFNMSMKKRDYTPGFDFWTRARRNLAYFRPDPTAA